MELTYCLYISFVVARALFQRKSCPTFLPNRFAYSSERHVKFTRNPQKIQEILKLTLQGISLIFEART